MPKKSAKKVVKKAVVKKTIAKKAVKKSAKKAVKKAGRPKGTGKFGCATKAVRVPAHLAEEIAAFAKKKIDAEKKSAK